MELLGRFEETYGKLKLAEKILLDSFEKGVFAKIGEVLPETQTPDNTVRSVFVRHLLQVYSSNVHIGSVFRLKGAYVEGVLDLRSLSVTTDINFVKCKFAQPINFKGAIFDRSIVFNNCELTSFYGERMVINGGLDFVSVRTEGTIYLSNSRIFASLNCEGSCFDGVGKEALVAGTIDVRANVFLNKGFSAKGGVSFKSSNVGGQFSCNSGRFVVEEGNALTLDSAVIGSSVFFHAGFSSKGTVRMLGVRISGQLACQDARFECIGKNHAITLERGYVRNNALFSVGCEVVGSLYLRGLVVDGNLEFNESSIENLKASEVRVKGRLGLNAVKQPPKSIWLDGARVSFLNDDLRSWGENPHLNGFVYDFIDVQKPMSVSERITWLKKQKSSINAVSDAKHFRPQPWRQLQQALESMGNTEEAKEVGIEYEHCLRKFGLIGQSPDNWNHIFRKLYSKWAIFLHFLYGCLTGFGYRPMLLLPWFALVWALCAGIYWGAANSGVFAPSNPLVFQSEMFDTCRPDREQAWLKKHPDRRVTEMPEAYKGIGNWYFCEELREEYTGFSPIAFSLDLLLPLVDLHQENDWAPLIATPKVNWIAEIVSFFSVKRLVRFVMWCEILAGWGFSLLFVAMVSGLARRKE